jgi:hypothetical protein
LATKIFIFLFIEQQKINDGSLVAGLESSVIHISNNMRGIQMEIRSNWNIY